MNYACDVRKVLGDSLSTEHRYQTNRRQLVESAVLPDFSRHCLQSKKNIPAGSGKTDNGGFSG
jgi:hypothetical protein